MLAFAGAVLFMGCKQSVVNSDEADNPPAPMQGENFSFYSSSDMYEELREKGKKGKSGIGDAFEITDVWRTEEDDKKYLHIEVTHNKACDERFQVVWNGAVAESYPLQTWLLVKLDAEDCPNLNSVTSDTLSLDLYKFLGDERYLADENMIFHVYNVSSDQDVNYDEPVSDS
mgnify:FL=1